MGVAHRPPGRTLLLGTCVAGAVLLGACGSSTTSTPASTPTTVAATTSTTVPSNATVAVVRGVHGLGPILVTSSGRTLYRYVPDGTGPSTCTGPCAEAWPPLTVVSASALVAGPGLDHTQLATVARPDGTLQVTYAGHPLYTYLGDKTSGQVAGQGVASVWFVVTPAKVS